MKKILYTAFYFCSALLLSSCIGDLDQYPHEDETSSTIYTSADNYKAVLGKIYAAMVTTGQEKGGDPDLSSNSGQDYMRCFFNLQECGTDEVASTWLSGDNVTGLTYLSWDANDPWVSDMYYRIYYNIALCNEFLRNATDESIARFTEQEQTEIRHYRVEARFMRALFYYHAMDLFRNIPFVTENDPTVGYLPPRYTAAQVFSYIESELTSITSDMLDRANCPYGRASRGAAYTLLAKLYLNAEVYINTPKYTECISACKEVIKQGYSLEDDYNKLFNADNDKRTANEIIFTLPVDATHTVSWGSSTYIVCGAVSNTSDLQKPEDYGVKSGWGMFRVRGEIPSLFTGEEDKRAMFFTDGQTLNLDKIDDQSNGYFVEKWTNLTESNPTERILTLNGTIAEESWFDDDITPQLFKSELNSCSGNITVWINSPGGDCVAAAQIYNMLMDYKGNVTVKIDGIAASAASVIAMAGNNVMMSPVSMLMIHNPATVAMGDHNEMQKAIEMLEEVKESIINAYEIKTGMSRAKLARLMEEETWMNAKKAVELGFADSIIEPDKKINEDEKEKNKASDSILFSRRAVSVALQNKLKSHYLANAGANTGTDITDLEKRLNLLKP